MNMVEKLYSQYKSTQKIGLQNIDRKLTVKYNIKNKSGS